MVVEQKQHKRPPKSDVDTEQQHLGVSINGGRGIGRQQINNESCQEQCDPNQSQQSPSSRLGVTAPPSRVMSVGGTQQRRRRRLARRRAYNRSHRRHKSSRNLFVSYADDDDNFDSLNGGGFSMSVPSTSLADIRTTTCSSTGSAANAHDCDSLISSCSTVNTIDGTSTTATRPKTILRTNNGHDMNNHPFQFYPNDHYFHYSSKSNKTNNDDNSSKQLEYQSANESGCEFVSEPQPDNERPARPIARAPNNSTSSSNNNNTESPYFFLSNPFVQFRNYHNQHSSNSSSLSNDLAQSKQPYTQLDNATSSKQGKKQLQSINPRHNQHLLQELNSSGSLDSTTHSRRSQLAPTRSSHGLAPVATAASSSTLCNNKSPTNLSNNKTNTNFFSSLLGSRRRLEMSTSSNELVLASSNQDKQQQQQFLNSSGQDAAQPNSSSARGSSPAILDKTKRLSKSSMRIEIPPTVKSTRYTFLPPTHNSASGKQRLQQRNNDLIQGQDLQNVDSLPRTNCSLDYVCRAISLDSPPSSSYVLSELAISQLACIDNVHFSDLFHGSVNESASSINLQQSVSSDPRLYQDDVDIKFSRTLNSCRLPQIRYATKERLFERLTDLRFLSIDFLNTFLLTYRVFATGEEVLEALKNVHYNHDEYIARGLRNQQDRVSTKLHEAELKQSQQEAHDLHLQANNQNKVFTSSSSKPASPKLAATATNHAQLSSADQSQSSTPEQQSAHFQVQEKNPNDNKNLARKPPDSTTANKSAPPSRPPTIPARTNPVHANASPMPTPPPPPPPNQLLLPSQLSIQKRRSTINALSPITGSTSSSLINLTSNSRQTSRDLQDLPAATIKSECDTPTLSPSPLESSNEQLCSGATTRRGQGPTLDTQICTSSLIVPSVHSDDAPQSAGSEGDVATSNRSGLLCLTTDRARSSSVSNQAGEYRGRLTLDIPNQDRGASLGGRPNRAQSISYVPQNVQQQLPFGQQQPCEHWRITFHKHVAREEAAQQAAAAAAAAAEADKRKFPSRLQTSHSSDKELSDPVGGSSSFKIKLDLVAAAAGATADQAQLGVPTIAQPSVPPTTPISGQMPSPFGTLDGDRAAQSRVKTRDSTGRHHRERSRRRSRRSRNKLAGHARISTSTNSSSSSSFIGDDEENNAFETCESRDAQELDARSQTEEAAAAVANLISSGANEDDEDDDGDGEDGQAVFLRVGRKRLERKKTKNKERATRKIARESANCLEGKGSSDSIDGKLRQMSLVKEIDLVSGPAMDSSGDDASLAFKLATGEMPDSTSNSSSQTSRSLSASSSSADSSDDDDDDEVFSDPNSHANISGPNHQAAKTKVGRSLSSSTTSTAANNAIDLEKNSRNKQSEASYSQQDFDNSKSTGLSSSDFAYEQLNSTNPTLADQGAPIARLIEPPKPQVPARSGAKQKPESPGMPNSGLLAAINSMQSKFRRSSVSASFAPDSRSAAASDNQKNEARELQQSEPKQTTPPTPPLASRDPGPPPSHTASSGRLSTPRSSCQQASGAAGPASTASVHGGEMLEYATFQPALPISPVSRAGVVVSSRSPRLSTRRSSNSSALSAFAVATAACDNSMLTQAPPHIQQHNQQQLAQQHQLLHNQHLQFNNVASRNMAHQSASVSNSRASSRLSSLAGLESGGALYSSCSINQSQVSLLPGQQQQQNQPASTMLHGRQSVASSVGPMLGSPMFHQTGGGSTRNKRRSTTGGGGQPVKSARSVATLRVLSVLRHWISKHSPDFVNDPHFSAQTQEFLRDLIDDPRLLSTEHKSAIQLHQMVERASQSRDQQIDLNLLLASPQSPSKESIETLSALEIAEGMTFLDHKIFLAIRSEEFLSQAWMKTDKAIRAPHILLMTKRFNDVSRLVSSEIIRVQEMHRRVAVIEKWTNVAHICRVVHNFNGVLQICAAFTNSAVFRLKKTWDKISKTTRTTIDQLQTLVSTDSRFRNMRDAINRCDPPSIPYVGMYLTDLSFIEEGTPNFAPDGLLNFSKMRMIAHVIREIQHLQKGIYKIDISPKVANYLLDSSRHLTDDQMYKSSLAIEARSASSAASHSAMQPTQQHHGSAANDIATPSNTKNQQANISSSSSGNNNQATSTSQSTNPNSTNSKAPVASPGKHLATNSSNKH